jgi:simple sugar transport system ATP-binding protein
MLVDTLTVLENIILGDETTGMFGMIDFKLCESKVNEILKSFRIDIDLKAKVETLPVGTQQKIEILKLLYRNADILILDEPTAVLTPQETEELFRTLKELKTKGKTIILITHKLGEVLTVSDSVTVLRHGKSVGELETKSTSHNELAKLIMGEEINLSSAKESFVKDKTVLSIRDLTVLNDKNIEALKNVSFDVKAGEILGIAGVEGNGQAELIEAINGLREIKHGEVVIEGKKNYTGSIAHIPSDRHKHGIVMEYTVAENVILGRERETGFSTPFALKQKEIISHTKTLIKQYDVRPQNPVQKIRRLSGGNQQKVVAARELTKQTDLIIATNPTRGLDIKAMSFVYSALVNECKKGKAVLLVSSDLAELFSLSDRIAVMYGGEITAMLSPTQTNEKQIGLYMTGMHK